MDDAMVLVDEQPDLGPEGEQGTYTVTKGDTLWTIASRFLGSAQRYAEIYDLNKEVIETGAKDRGKKDSSNGHWIFPGTELQLPLEEGKRNVR